MQIYFLLFRAFLQQRASTKTTYTSFALTLKRGGGRRRVRKSVELSGGIRAIPKTRPRVLKISDAVNGPIEFRCGFHCGGVRLGRHESVIEYCRLRCTWRSKLCPKAQVKCAAGLRKPRGLFGNFHRKSFRCGRRLPRRHRKYPAQARLRTVLASRR